MSRRGLIDECEREVGLDGEEEFGAAKSTGPPRIVSARTRGATAGAGAGAGAETGAGAGAGAGAGGEARARTRDGAADGDPDEGEEIDEANTMSVLIATDLHVGYKEKHGVRGVDSFLALEEVLRIAKREKVDLLLLGGDLFHENHPSRSTIYRVMELLRKYCTGDGDIAIQLRSDPRVDFVSGDSFPFANYEDPNYNIELPVFSIHGNHDDPSREGARRSLSAVDLLSMANLVNYFGKSERVDDVNITPVLLQKGSTKVALYGLGAIRDERLNRMFNQGKVKFRRPAEDPESWFNIFVIHQNRNDTGRGKGNCVTEAMLPDFLDLVIWGHEHECLIEPVESIADGKKFWVTQPGSTIATSLIPGEATRKHVGLLELNGTNFRMTPIPLTMVRPFMLKEVSLGSDSGLSPGDPRISEAVSKFLEEQVESLLDEIGPTVDEFAADPEREPLKLPLIRLKVEHSEFPTINNQRFGSKFESRVANPSDILQFHRRSRRSAPTRLARATGPLTDDDAPGDLDRVCVEDLVLSNLLKMDRKLSVFAEPDLTRVLEQYVHKNNVHALSEFIEDHLKSLQRMVKKQKEAETTDHIVAAVEKATESARRKALAAAKREGALDAIGAGASGAGGGARAGAGAGIGAGSGAGPGDDAGTSAGTGAAAGARSRGGEPHVIEDPGFDDGGSDEEVPATSTRKPRGRAAAASGSRTKRAPASKRGRAETFDGSGSELENDPDGFDDELPPPRPRTTRGAAASARPAKRRAAAPPVRQRAGAVGRSSDPPAIEIANSSDDEPTANTRGGAARRGVRGSNSARGGTKASKPTAAEVGKHGKQTTLDAFRTTRTRRSASNSRGDSHVVDGMRDVFGSSDDDNGAATRPASDDDDDDDDDDASFAPSTRDKHGVGAASSKRQPSRRSTSQVTRPSGRATTSRLSDRAGGGNRKYEASASVFDSDSDGSADPPTPQPAPSKPARRRRR